MTIITRIPGAGVVLLESPLISIIIPTRSRADLLRQTLESLRRQSEPRWEAIVVDDGSAGGTEAMVRAMAAEEGRIHYHQRTRSPAGAPACRNIGFQLAVGKYAIFLDDDDLLAEHCLAERLRFMGIHPELDFAVWPAELFEVVPGDLGRLLNCDSGEDDLARFLRFDTPWQTMCPMWRREALDRVGPWDEELATGQDMDFCGRALIAGLKYARGCGVDSYYRVHTGGRPRTSSTGKDWGFDSHVRRVVKTYQLLVRAGRLDDTRRRLIVGNLLHWAAMMGVSGAPLREVLATWAVARKPRLATGLQWLAGAAYLLLRRTWLAVLAFPFVYHSLGNDAFVKSRGTLAQMSVGEPHKPRILTPADAAHPFFGHAEIVRDGMQTYVSRRWLPSQWFTAIRRRLSPRSTLPNVCSNHTAQPK